MRGIQKHFRDPGFYRMVLAVALPIMIQNGITNFVGMLDNIMVGQIGTVQMNGVAIVNQLMFVFNLCIFGAVSGAGIFTAQFSGSKDHEGVRYTFRFKMLICLVLSLVGLTIFLTAGKQLVSTYLKGDGAPEDAAATLHYSLRYLRIMVIGLVPFAFANSYAGTLRETGETMVPMISGIVAVLVNLIFNYILIFGHFGAPAMGVEGAAIATVLSRFVELGILAAWTHGHPGKNPFIVGAYRSPKIPLPLTRRIVVKGMPLLMNEFLWSFGIAMLAQCYSTRGLHVIGATNITNTLWNVFNVTFLAMGNAVGIIIGRLLGAGERPEKVWEVDQKLIRFSVESCILFGLLYALTGQVFPQIYNTTEQVRELARVLILIGAVFMPFNAYTNAAYFTLRSGGKTLVTFLFDSCFVWTVCVPTAYCLAHFTDIPIVPLYLICQSLEVLKCCVGFFMIHRKTWIQNIVENSK